MVIVVVIISPGSINSCLETCFIRDNESLELEADLIKIKNKADIFIQYLETDLENIHTYIAHGSSFDEACQQWLDVLEKTSFFDVKLKILENLIYKEIKEYKGTTQDHHVTFFYELLTV